MEKAPDDEARVEKSIEIGDLPEVGDATLSRRLVWEAARIRAGHENHGNLGVPHWGAEKLKDLHAAVSREVHVQQKQIKAKILAVSIHALEEGDGLRTVGNHRQRMVQKLFIERYLKQDNIGWIVFGDEYFEGSFRPHIVTALRTDPRLLPTAIGSSLMSSQPEPVKPIYT